MDEAKKVILVTGATDGIGRETARQLASQGHRVILHGRTAARAEAARRELLRDLPSGDLATSPEVEGVTGEYFVRKKAVAASRVARDVTLRAGLWAASERLLGLAPTG